jgi:hypothetical protein
MARCLRKCLCIIFLSLLPVLSYLPFQAQASQGWLIYTVDSAGMTGLHSSLALDSNGYPHISYFDSTTRDLKYAHWTGSIWTTEIVDPEDKDAILYSSFALDANDNPYIAYNYLIGPLKYAEDSNPNPDVTAWVIETVDAGTMGYSPSLSLDSAGNPHVAYNEFSNTGENALKYAKWNGSRWIVQIVESDEQFPPGWQSLKLDSSGNPHISYCKVFEVGPPFISDLKYAWVDTGIWYNVTVDSGYVGTGISLALENGNPRIAYYEATSGLKYAEGTFSTFSTGTINWEITTLGPIGDVGLNSPSLALDSMGNPHISYYNATDGNIDLQYASWSGSSWIVTNVDSLSSVGQGVSLALDSADKPHISYQDNTNGDLKYAVLVDQCQVTFSQTGVENFNGIVLTVDSVSYRASDLPISFNWVKGSSHSFAYTSPLDIGSGERCLWAATTGLSSLQSDTLTINGDGIISANYQLQYQLTVSKNFGTVSPASGEWYAAGSTVTISSTAPSAESGERYNWNGWNGTGSGSYSGSSNLATITMNSAVTQTASYTHQFYLTIFSSHGSKSGEGWYDEGSTANFEVSATEEGETGTQYVFVGWTGTGSVSYSGSNNSQSVIMNSPITETAMWKTQFSVSFATNPEEAGITTPSTDMWVDEGSSIAISASPYSGYVFSSWSKPQSITLTSPSSGTTATINGPGTIIANFVSSPIDSTSEDSVTPENPWYDSRELFVAILSFALALLVAIGGVIRYRMSKRKDLRQKQLIARIKKTYEDFKNDPQKCDSELCNIKSDIKEDLKAGKITNEGYNTLDKIIDDYRRETENKPKNETRDS